MDLGAPELFIILIVILVLFGGAKLPQLARSLGQAQSEFRKGIRGIGSSDNDEDDPPSKSEAGSGDDVVTSSRDEDERLVDEPDRERPEEPPGQDT